MKSQVLNRRQARWAMFLADFDFTLEWAPEASNVADAPSRHSYFVPQRGDECIELQQQTLLNSKHTQFLFPHLDTTQSLDTLQKTTEIQSLHTLPTSISYFSSLSSLTTLTLDNSDLLDPFLTAYNSDDTWKRTIAPGNLDYSAQNNLVFYQGRLYVPPSLHTQIVHNRHDAIIAGHPGCTRTLCLV